MYLNFTTNTAGTLRMEDERTAVGRSGDANVVIHAVATSGGTPQVRRPPVGSCKLSCRYPCGQCTAARFPVDRYSLSVPGERASAVHVIDGHGRNEARAAVESLDAVGQDPTSGRNAGVIGAAVLRGERLTYVVASARWAEAGASGVALTYATRGDRAARHVVFDVPRGRDGGTTITSTVLAGHCRITVAVGSGTGSANHLSSASGRRPQVAPWSLYKACLQPSKP
jgi:hypothetical protein